MGPRSFGNRRGAEYVHLRFEAAAQAEIGCSDREPPLRLLIEIQPTPNLHRPTVIQSNLTIVQLVVNPHLQSYVVLQQAFLQLIELLLEAFQISLLALRANNDETSPPRKFTLEGAR